MFTLNEIQEFSNNNCEFNTSFDIELTFPKYENKKYKLIDLFDFKYNQIDNISNYNNQPLKIVKRKICKLPDILIITILRAIVGRNFICILLYIPQEINLEKYIDKELLPN